MGRKELGRNKGTTDGSTAGGTGQKPAEGSGQDLAGSQTGGSSVETPEKFVPAINLATANTIGIRISRTVLERTDRLMG